MKISIKYFTIVLIVISVQIIFAQKNIHNIHSLNHEFMKFVSDKDGWLVNKDYIKKTYDGGRTWEVKLTLDTETYYTEYIKNCGISFLDANTGFFVLFTRTGNNYFLFKTTDGGDSWQQRSISGENITNNDVSHLTFLNINIGWARNNWDNIIRTTDGGITWELMNEDLGNIYKIKFVNESLGYYYTTSGLFKTVDGGYNWVQLNTGVTYHWDFDVVGDELWVGSDGIYYSPNAGETWSKISSDVTLGNVSKLYMIDKNYGIVSNNSGYAYFTENGGLNWSLKSTKFGLSSFFDSNNGWFYSDGYLTKAENKFDTTYTVFPKMDFSDVVIVNDLVIIASSTNGAIIRSNDGGKTWTFINDLYGKYYIYDLCFGEAGNGVAVGYYLPSNSAYNMAFIAKTNDVGATWQIVMEDTGEPYGSAIYSADYSSGKYYVKSVGRMLSSIDLGQNWSIDSTDWGGAAFSQTDFIGNTGFGISLYGTQPLVKSINGGTGWVKALNEDYVQSVYYLAENLIWANFGPGKNLKSLNGGDNWIDAELDFQNIYFKNQLLGIAYGYLNNNDIFSDGTYLTLDGGNTWELLNYPQINFTRHAIDFTSKQQGFLASQFDLYSMQVYGDVDSIVSVEKSDFTEIPKEFSLSQNYPNPFNPSTVIEFALPTSGNVSLKVFNSIGEEVAELINSEMNAGNYSIKFDAKNMSSGIYFYRITSGNFTQTNKMLLLK